MDAETAQVVASVCGLLATIAVVVGQVLLGRQVADVKHLVNGQSHALTRLTGDEAYSRGRLEGASGAAAGVAPASSAPPQITPR